MHFLDATLQAPALPAQKINLQLPLQQLRIQDVDPGLYRKRFFVIWFQAQAFFSRLAFAKSRKIKMDPGLDSKDANN